MSGTTTNGVDANRSYQNLREVFGPSMEHAHGLNMGCGIAEMGTHEGARDSHKQYSGATRTDAPALPVALRHKLGVQIYLVVLIIEGGAKAHEHIEHAEQIDDAVHRVRPRDVFDDEWASVHRPPKLHWNDDAVVEHKGQHRKVPPVAHNATRGDHPLTLPQVALDLCVLQITGAGARGQGGAARGAWEWWWWWCGVGGGRGGRGPGASRGGTVIPTRGSCARTASWHRGHDMPC